MTSTYQTNREWSDQFIPEIRQFVGPHLLQPSTLEEDTLEATDLIILRARDLRIACRVRRYGYAQKYPRQFTLRSRASRGGKTELDKVIEGWGDWLFYGHADKDSTCIEEWHLVDLSAFRAHLIRKASRRTIRQEERSNGDGTMFRSFAIDSFVGDPRLLIAEQCYTRQATLALVP